MKYKLPITIKFACAFVADVGAAIALVSLCFTLVPTQPVKSQVPETEIFNAPPPPPDINAPGNRTAGGKRGCESMQKQPAISQEKFLTALVPVYQPPNAELVFGLTTISHPTFWFYVPYKTTSAAEFVLQNQAGQTVYQNPVSLSGTPGIVSVSLPSTASSLKIGDRYHWYFNIYCNPQQPPVFVDGWIKRIEPNTALKSQLEKATPKQRVALYATHGIWYELVTASAELRRLEPKRNDWAKILQSVGLNDIASEPIVDCCR
ncbi:hypothetical protein BV372_27745 [Nostoc sp. T09]|uniref:DUF928 domain-containing protein n=1 Tax=Nostoc sp. T09 TaxID=1932621 RepID=UPI000A374887|nr:DUF928 domain-containing protein [Nostoc sp. T09]OUL25469.1 hypothetical protein BV372_27745 [Nostoc sp. T09]